MSTKILKQQLSILSKKDHLKLSFGKAKKGKTNVFGQKTQRKPKKTTLEKVQEEQNSRDYLKVNLKYIQKATPVRGKEKVLAELQKREKIKKSSAVEKEKTVDAGLNLTKAERKILGLKEDDDRFNGEDEVKQIKL
eukprot:TRINITY_DN6546_c0_g2_i1.p1 TRINITY_DN6546_c0_g2~~TRINITY_DN6546_c0_g2_i1.p1  ORF type:complete len:136 (-),score=39.42 TRINITY_DN6546_c0_g2_i1:58-465(-)